MIKEFNRALIVSIIFLSLASIGYGFSCDAGTISGTCNITSSQSVTDETVSGDGKLIVKSGGTLSTGAGPGTTASLDFGDIKVIGVLRGNFKLQAETFNLTSSGTVNADGKGYDGGYFHTDDGEGPGAGGAGGCGNDKRGGGGAGYGGNGQDGDRMNNGGGTYGTASEPDRLGSGGGAGGENGCSGGGDRADGGRGGGKIKINTTRKAVIEGTLTADGYDGYDSSNHGGGGGGSGGSIWILTQDLYGSGSVSARAGTEGRKTDASFGDGGHGGGGRIAFYYKNNYGSISKDVWGADDGTKYTNSSYEPPGGSICDVETTITCTLNQEKSINSRSIGIQKNLFFDRSAKITGIGNIFDVTDTLKISGVLKGEFNMTGDEAIIKPGAEMTPENGRILIRER